MCWWSAWGCPYQELSLFSFTCEGRNFFSTSFIVCTIVSLVIWCWIIQRFTDVVFELFHLPESSMQSSQLIILCYSFLELIWVLALTIRWSHSITKFLHLGNGVKYIMFLISDKIVMCFVIETFPSSSSVRFYVGIAVHLRYMSYQKKIERALRSFLHGLPYWPIVLFTLS